MWKYRDFRRTPPTTAFVFSHFSGKSHFRGIYLSFYFVLQTLAMKNYLVKRAGRRKNIRKPITFELSLLENGRPINILKSGVGVDLSPGGLGMTTAYPLHTGNILKLFFPAGVGNTSLPVFTEVVWSQTVDEHFRVGLRFLA